MIKSLKVILVVIVLAVIGGWFYWQQNKKSIIKNTIENAISKGSDSLYFIRYDRSFIDEVAGNASFFNLTLQSDSLQRQLLLFDTASSATIYNIQIDEVMIKGANIPGLISNTLVEANLVLIKHPVVYIIKAGKKEKKILNSDDSLAIYEKLLGKFKSINAGEIAIENGVLIFTDKTGQPNIALRDINIRLKKFRIDSTRNYQNIISYFVKDMVAKVKEVYVKGDKNQATFTDVEYNAPEKFIYLKNFRQKNSDGKLAFDINNTFINNISTNAFITQQQLHAEELKTDGGMLTFYTKPKNDAGYSNSEIEIDNNYFDEAQVNKVDVGNTKILIYNKAKPGKAPIVINHVKFNASEIQKLHSGINLKNLISNSNWQLSGDGFSFLTENSRYKVNVGAFIINNNNASLLIKNFTVKPQVNEAAFSKTITHQQDLYNLEFNNIQLTDIDTRLLMTQLKLEAAEANLQPVIKIYRDRTIAEDLSSKVGKYPQQLMQTIKFPFNIKKINIRNGLVVYTEKAFISQKTGTVFFKNINSSISNVTNISNVVSSNNLLILDATASFMGISKLHSVWKLALNNSDGNFEISGSVGGFDAVSLNPMIEPLGMTSIKKGRVNKLTYNLTGNNYSAKGSETFLYNNLKIEVLKLDSGDVKKKGLQTFLANALMKNNNPTNGVIRTEEIDYKRDISKSFFNLMWKSIFSGAKKTVQKL